MVCQVIYPAGSFGVADNQVFKFSVEEIIPQSEDFSLYDICRELYFLMNDEDFFEKYNLDCRSMSVGDFVHFPKENITYRVTIDGWEIESLRVIQ